MSHMKYESAPGSFLKCASSIWAAATMGLWTRPGLELVEGKQSRFSPRSGRVASELRSYCRMRERKARPSPSGPSVFRGLADRKRCCGSEIVLLEIEENALFFFADGFLHFFR